MENYYVPVSIEQPVDSTEFGVSWAGSSYKIFNVCPDTGIGGTLPYNQINAYGYPEQKGTEVILSTSNFIIGTGCSTSATTISQGEISNNILDAPAYTMWYPIYFIAILFTCLFMISFAWRTILGRKLG